MRAIGISARSRAALGLAAVTVTAVAIATWQRVERAPAASASVVVGSALPPLVGDPLDGPVSSTTGVENCVVAVVSWAAWCDPCRRLVRDLSGLASGHRREGLHVVGLAQDADAAASSAFAAEAGLDFGSLHDRLGAMTSGRWGWTTMPTLVIADRAGVVRFRHEGHRGDEADGVAAEIATLLGEAR